MKTVKTLREENVRKRSPLVPRRGGFEKRKYGFMEYYRNRKFTYHCITVSAPSPQLQFGRPPTAGRKMAAVLVHLNPNQLLLQVSLVRILGNDREVKKKKIV